MSASVSRSARASALLHAWQKTVDQAPDAIAVIEAESGRAFRRAEINALAQTFAAENKSLPSPRARVAFAQHNGAEWLRIFLGVLMAGGIPMPIDPGEPAPRQRELASLAGAALWTGKIERVGPLKRDAAGLCLIKLTSGSTGTPRALPFLDREMLADGRQICATMSIAPEDRNLAVIPFGHSYGLGNLVIPLLEQGTAVVCASSPLPHALAADCARWSPTIFPTVPALLRVLARAEISPQLFASLRVVISAGSALPPEIAGAFYEKFHRIVHNFYGSSETGGIAYDRSGEATRAGRAVGTPLEGVRISVGRAQRFWVESAAVFTRGNPQKSRSGLGRVQPLDRAEWNKEKELRLLGRTGRMVKIGGRRVDLAEIESDLRKISGVREVWVAMSPKDADSFGAVFATDMDRPTLLARLRDAFAPWKIPKKIALRAELPLTRRGKVDTAALQASLFPESRE